MTPFKNMPSLAAPLLLSALLVTLALIALTVTTARAAEPVIIPTSRGDIEVTIYSNAERVRWHDQKNGCYYRYLRLDTEPLPAIIKYAGNSDEGKVLDLAYLEPVDVRQLMKDPEQLARLFDRIGPVKSPRGEIKIKFASNGEVVELTENKTGTLFRYEYLNHPREATILVYSAANMFLGSYNLPPAEQKTLLARDPELLVKIFDNAETLAAKNEQDKKAAKEAAEAAAVAAAIKKAGNKVVGGVELKGQRKVKNKNRGLLIEYLYDNVKMEHIPVTDHWQMFSYNEKLEEKKIAETMPGAPFKKWNTYWLYIYADDWEHLKTWPVRKYLIQLDENEPPNANTVFRVPCGTILEVYETNRKTGELEKVPLPGHFMQRDFPGTEGNRQL